MLVENFCSSYLLILTFYLLIFHSLICNLYVTCALSNNYFAEKKQIQMRQQVNGIATENKIVSGIPFVSI